MTGSVPVAGGRLRSEWVNDIEDWAGLTLNTARKWTAKHCSVLAPTQASLFSRIVVASIYSCLDGPFCYRM